MPARPAGWARRWLWVCMMAGWRYWSRVRESGIIPTPIGTESRKSAPGCKGMRALWERERDHDDDDDAIVTRTRSRSTYAAFVHGDSHHLLLTLSTQRSNRIMRKSANGCSGSPYLSREQWPPPSIQHHQHLALSRLPAKSICKRTHDFSRSHWSNTHTENSPLLTMVDAWDGDRHIKHWPVAFLVVVAHGVGTFEERRQPPRREGADSRVRVGQIVVLEHGHLTRAVCQRYAFKPWLQSQRHKQSAKLFSNTSANSKTAMRCLERAPILKPNTRWCCLATEQLLPPWSQR